MIDTKKIGRPRKFDYGTALIKAMSVFWAKGYEGASLRDLTGAMGITGPSLYATFGDKRELYLKAIDHYCEADACAPLVALKEAENIEEALQAFLLEVIHSATDHESGAKGCFLASSVATSIGQVDGVDSRVQAAVVHAEEKIEARFQAEIDKGNLPRHFPAKERASLLFDIRQGYMFRGRVGVDKEKMQNEVTGRVKMLLTC